MLFILWAIVLGAIVFVNAVEFHETLALLIVEEDPDAETKRHG
jgi:hypothetical protein